MNREKLKLLLEERLNMRAREINLATNDVEKLAGIIAIKGIENITIDIKKFASMIAIIEIKNIAIALGFEVITKQEAGKRYCTYGVIDPE